jgi:hypothetical protein
MKSEDFSAPTPHDHPVGSINNISMDYGLPMLYAPPKLTLIRLMHKKMRHLEYFQTKDHREGEHAPLLEGEARNNHKTWYWVVWYMFVWLLLPITFPFMVRGRARWQVIGMAIFVVLELATAFVPIGSFIWEAQESFTLTYAPLAIIFLIALIVSTVQFMRGPKGKGPKELAAFHVKVSQKLKNGRYGYRQSTGEDLLYAITSREEQGQDRPIFRFMTYVFSVIAALVHGVVVTVYLYKNDHLHSDPVPIVAICVNFLLVLCYLVGLGVTLTAYNRQLKLLRFFTAVTSKTGREMDLPILELNQIENIVCWMKIRAYIRRHEHLPLICCNSVLSWSLLSGVMLWVFLITQVFANKTVFNLTGLVVVYDAVLMTVYVAATLIIGSRINGINNKHIVLLHKEALQRTLDIQVRSNLALSKQLN